MSYEGQDPNRQPSQPGTEQYGGYYTPPQQPQPTDPYSGQQYGQQGGYQQQPPYGQPQSGYQQPPYGQQQGGYQPPYSAYQQPYGQQQQSFSTGTTSMGMSPNVAAGLSYVFVWISGLVIFLVEKQNRFVRFHAMQSILFFGGLTVLRILLGFLVGFPLLGLLAGALIWLVGVVGFVGWIVLMVKGFQGQYFKLPYIGDYAEKYANQNTL